jgi:coenzyme F420-0:L-glutamate ligase/coenzyme F420-1:gamma-L-glutamate ligase
MNDIRIFGVRGMPEVAAGDDLPGLIAQALHKMGERLHDGDVVAVTSKIVSKAEGRIVREQDVVPSDFAVALAQHSNKSAAEIEVILRESARPVKMIDRVMIMETKHGFICANAGVDRSNVAGEGAMLMLPEDPDRSAEHIRLALEERFGVSLAVVITDTFGRPWRVGQTNVAIGVSGMAPILDYKGRKDNHDRTLQATAIAVADELAGAAELVMNKTDRIPVAVIRGYPYVRAPGKAGELIRPKHLDLFQ